MLGVTLKPGVLGGLVNKRTEAIAEQLGITPRTALRYLTLDGMRELAQNTVRGLKEHQAAEDARLDTIITTEEASLFVPVFALTARIGLLLNGDADVAADLCEVVAAVGLALGSSPPTAPTALMRSGVRWAELVAEQLGAGAWVTDPAHPSTVEQDLALAAKLRVDLDSIAERLGRP